MKSYFVIIVFTVAWWVVFYLSLPIGIEIEDKPSKGHVRSAPKNPKMKAKLIWTTIIASIITFCYFKFAVVN